MSTITAPVNASGAVPIPGFRLDRPYPGDWSEPTTSDPSARWTLRMNVSTGTDEGVGNAPEKSRTVITVVLTPPPPGNEGAVLGGSNNSVWQVPENITETWRLVIWSFDFIEMKTVRELNDREDGSCPFSVVSEACQKDLRNVAHTMPESVFNVGRPVNDISFPVENSDACAEDGWTKGTYRLVDLNQNFTRKTNWYIHSDDYSPYPPPEDHDTYKQFGSRTFPLMLIWAKELPENLGSYTTIDHGDYPPIEDSHISFACVRADTLGDENQNGSLPYEQNDVIEFDGADKPASDAGSGAGMVFRVSRVLLWTVWLAAISFAL